MHLFRRKAIDDLLAGEDASRSLKRVLGAGDLIMLAIGAVIGAGIFGAIGTAAAGQVGLEWKRDPLGGRPGAGLLVPAAGRRVRACRAVLRGARLDDSAGGQRLRVRVRDARRARRVDHRLGPDPRVRGRQRRRRDFVGRLLQHADPRGVRSQLPRGSRPAIARRSSARMPEVHGLLETAPRIAGIPILVNLPAFAIVMFITWLLLRGVRESARANNIMVVIKLLALGALRRRRRDAPRRRPTTRRSRRTASPASTRAPRSCSSPTSASTRSRPRPRRRRTRSATCRSASSAGSRSAR